MASSRGGASWGATGWGDDDEWEDVDAVATVATTAAVAPAKAAVAPTKPPSLVELPVPPTSMASDAAADRNGASEERRTAEDNAARPPAVVVGETVRDAAAVVLFACTAVDVAAFLRHETW